MPLHVKRQMVRPGEGALTQVALERPVSGVFPEMTGQLVGAGEFPTTALPAAVVWLLTCVERNGNALAQREGGFGRLCVITRRCASLSVQNSPVWVRRCAFRCELLV